MKVIAVATDDVVGSSSCQLKIKNIRLTKKIQKHPLNDLEDVPSSIA